MNSPENTKSPEKIPETAYPIKLRPPVFSYIAENLRPYYQLELAEAHGLRESPTSSRIIRIMGNMLDQFPDPNTLPDNPVLPLSKQDISFLKQQIERPQDAANGQLWSEMMREVDEAFTDAKFRSKAESFIQGIKSRLKPKP